MAKRKQLGIDVATLQPDELNELKKVVGEFVQRLQNIDNEVAMLKESRKDLIDEYKSKLDIETFNLALKTIKIESLVERKDTYDLFKDVLKDDVTNGHVDA